MKSAFQKGKYLISPSKICSAWKPIDLINDCTYCGAGKNFHKCNYKSIGTPFSVVGQIMAHVIYEPIRDPGCFKSILGNDGLAKSHWRVGYI